MKSLWKRKFMKRRKKFLVPIIKLQPQSLKFEERLKVSFLLLASKFQNPTLKVGDKLSIFYCFPSISKLKARSFMHGRKKEVNVASNLWHQKLRLRRKKNL
jgi:hypothetical protein